MSVAKVTEITSTSTTSFDDALQQGMKRANESLKNVKSAWVKSQDVKCDESGAIVEYKVLLKVTFVLQ